MSESFRYYEEALGALRKLPDTPENKRRRIEIALLAREPILALGFKEGSLEILKEGQKLAEEIGDGSSLAQLCGFIAHFLSYKGDWVQGLNYGERALAEAERIGDVDTAVRVTTDFIGPLCYRGDFQKAASIVERAVVLIEKIGKTNDRFGTSFPLHPTLIAVHGYAKGMLGDFDQGEPCCERVVRLALESKEPRTLAMAEVICGFVSVVRGKDLESCQRHLRSSIRSAEEARFSPYLPLAWTCMGWAEWMQGNLEAARDCGQKAVSTQIEGRLSVMSSLAHLLLGAVSLDSGDLVGAQTSMEEALRLSQASGERYIEGRAGTWLGRVLGKADVSQAAVAEERILQGIRLLEQMQIKPWQAEGHLLAGELYADTGQEQKALTSLMKAQGMFQEMEMTHWLSRSQRALDRLQV